MQKSRTESGYHSRRKYILQEGTAVKIVSKVIARFLYYLSLIFLVAYLVKSNIFQFNTAGVNFLAVSISLLFCAGGFVLSAAGWYMTLRQFSPKTTFRVSMHSAGKSVFAKFIPGKIWIILTRASIAAEYGIDRAAAGFSSSLAQASSINTGLILGAFLLFGGKHGSALRITASILIVVLTVIMLSKKLQNSLFKLYARLLRTEISILDYSFREMLKTGLVFFLQWLTWGAGFCFLIYGIVPEWGFRIPFLFVFPLSATLGIVSLFAPGGLGVREGVMTGLLVFLGMEPGFAATVSIAARLWFLIGEIFIFVTGTCIHPAKGIESESSEKIAEKKEGN